MTDHTHCTCCRHWRKFEQPSLMDGLGRAPSVELTGEGHESSHDVVVGLLPPRPVAPLGRPR